MKKNLSNFLFIFLPFYRKFVIISNARAIDSVGRVPPSHGGSQGFESLIAHQRRLRFIVGIQKTCLLASLFVYLPLCLPTFTVLTYSKLFCNARFARYSVAVAPYESLIAHQRRGEAIFAKDCLSDGLFAFTLAAPFPKKFYNFLGSHFLRYVVTTKKVCKKCKPFYCSFYACRLSM